ncbi:hypothetical protein K0M31_016826 [Melipona bicolor]|uniref:Uncharacterized protein n=1 Tax=Melipona bicolor TaxID=60889 RepID=A0AA40FE04_9HYME|nr:hypothetical protein K0M31_016826 [Melipona bicolor]
MFEFRVVDGLQGFCCSCDPKANERRQYGGSNESSTRVSGAKSNYQGDNNAANKGRNRLRAGSSDDNSVARIQARGSEARSDKKSDDTDTESDIESHAEANEVCSSNELCLNKETGGNLEKSHESRENEASKVDGRELVERGQQSLSAEVAAGRTPDGDKAAANDVLATKSGRLWADERWNSKRVGPTTRVKNSGSSRSEDKRHGEGTNGNREFHSIGSKAEARKLSRVAEERISRNPFASQARVDDACSFRSRKRFSSARTQWKKLSAVNGREKRLRAESFYGDKSPAPKSGRRRGGKVFPVRSAANRPPMHLNEPLKNSSTGVSNSNGSPARWTARTGGVGAGNLNGVMGNTSPSRVITLRGTFNEKHGRAGELGCFQSRGNEKDEGSSFGSVGTCAEEKLKPVSKGRSVVSRPGDFSTKRADDEHPPRGAAAMKNYYTPQKRTLKDFSFVGDDYDSRDDALAGRRKLRKRESETNSLGSLRDWRNSRSARGRRKRSKSSARFPKNLRRIDDESRLGRLARDSIDDEKSEITDRKGEGGNDGNRQDSVDKQIEEKFSRISDALKEDTMMGSERIVQERKEDAFHANNPEASEKEKVLSNERGDDTEPSRRQIDQGSNERNSVETFDGVDKKAPSYQQTDGEDSSGGNKFPVNRDSYPSSQDEKSEEPVVANRENNPDEFLNNYTPSSGSQLVIPPPIDLSVIKEQNRVLAPESDDDTQPFDFVNPVSFTTEASDSTRALIVVDLFKIATGSLATLKEISESVSESPGFIDRLGGLKKNLEKAFQRLRPASRTLAITESTTVTLNETSTTNATSTTEGTTKITDKVFRPSIEGPPENATRTSPGGAEFHEEIGIEEATFPDETNPPITGVALPERLVDLASISRNQVAPSFKVTRKREKKSTTGSTIERRQSSVAPREHETDRLRGNTCGDNYDGRGCSTRADSTMMKFSLEAADVDVVREKLGVVSGSFSREQRNYVQVRVDDPGIQGSRRRAKARRLADSKKKKRRLRIGSREEETAKIGSESLRNGEIPVKGSREIKWINHPWFVTTETSEYTVDGQMDKYDRVFPSESSSPGRTLARGKKTRSEVRWNLATDGAPGRILPPCGKNRHRRVGDRGTKNVICETETNRGGRRLLSVQRLEQSGKNEADKEDRKKIREDNFVKGDGSEDIEYEDEDDVSERRKRLKSIRDKDREESKKRGGALKRKKTKTKTKTKKNKKKKKKNGEKERSAITSQDSPSEDYDYFLAGEQTSEEDGGNGLEGSVDGNDDYSNPALAGLSEEEANDGSRISEDVAADDNSHDRSISSDSPIDEFDGYRRGDLRSENQVSDRSGDDSVDLGEGEDGKDLEISLTGKIHLESDSYGRPVSISFNAEPEYFRKDFIDDGKANSHGNRFPLESADSSIDASDTLVSDAGTDNANFLPDVFDVEPSGANAPLDQVDDRSVAREYFPDAIRAGNRNAGRYRNELDPRQKLLRLRKKSVETGEKPAAKRDSKQSSRVNNGWKKSLRRSKKDSESSNLVDEREKLPESLNAERRNRNDLTKTSDEMSDNSSRASLDLSNDLPENNFESKEAVEAVASLEREGCLAMNSTTLRMELIGITTVTDKFQAPVTTTPLLSIHDLKMGDLSNVVESGTEVEKSTTAPATTTIISSLNETVVEAKISYPKPDLAIALATETTTTTAATTTMKLTDANETVVEAKMSYARPKLGTETAVQGSSSLPPAAEGSKESIERRNMLAISEFVKKLERLVADKGNSSNATGRTLIHLKKFIIVPDNRTFWSLREFSAPESRQEAGTTETVVVMGEGARFKGSGQSSENDEVGENSKGEERNLIKEIIDSIIGGDDTKREPTSKRSDKPNDHGESSLSDTQNGADALSPWSSEREFRTNLRVGKNAADLAKAQEEAPPRNSGKIVDDQFLESSLEKGGETLLKEYSDVCARNKSSVKGKRDVARSANQKRAREGKKKDAKRPKKKRRRKRKKKTEKGKGKREKKNGKKTKSKWPFKRNLLMLSEEEQIQPSNVDYGIKWGDRDKFPAKEEGRKNTESARKLPGENGSKEEPQIRGGQDCSDRKHPPNVDPLKYLESAHCLRFSDLWFVSTCMCMCVCVCVLFLSRGSLEQE